MQKNTTLALAAITFLTCAARAEFAFSEKGGTLQLHDGAKLITAFRTDYRIPYLYPLVSPSGLFPALDALGEFLLAPGIGGLPLVFHAVMVTEQLLGEPRPVLQIIQPAFQRGAARPP